MADPTPAELAKELRELASSPAGWRGLYRQELVASADALDQLAVSYDRVFARYEDCAHDLATLEGQTRQYRIERDKARREVTKTATRLAALQDRLAALEASLTDEWGESVERHDRDGWTTLVYDAEDREDAEGMVRTAKNLGNPPFRNAHLVRRRVTPWEAADDE